MSPAERTKVLLFLALFSGAVGFLSTLLAFGTEYWLLATETCNQPAESNTNKAIDGVRIFHEGLYWRCSFLTASNEYSVWDLWLFPSVNQPPSKVCQAAFLFPFPVNEPMRAWMEPYEHHSAIVFRTFWSIFLVAGWAAVVIGGFVVICAVSLANHKFYKLGGALLLFGGVCLLLVVGMYLMWVQVLDTLEQFVHHQSVSTCPSFHLSVQHGPSFLLAPVAVFFCLLAGPLFILIARSIKGAEPDQKEKIPELPVSDV